MQPIVFLQFACQIVTDLNIIANPVGYRLAYVQFSKPNFTDVVPK